MLLLTLLHHYSPSLMALFSSLITTLILINPSMNIVAEAKDPLSSPIPQDSQPGQHSSSTFKPGVGIVVGVMTLMFSLTFLFLLYIKHCSGGNTTDTAIGGGISASRAMLPSGGGRKNSGIDRSVVESLPIFRFGSLRGQKEGLDCAVCLNKFEATEVLRLLPKCKHAFHVECVDTWLDAHSTCPLCRCRVDPEDILLVVEKSENNQRNKKEKEGGGGEECCLDLERGGRNDAQRRHSSVGEREWEKERRKTTTSSSFRRSLDSSTSSASRIKKNYESVGVGVGIGCFVRPRKDGTLLTRDDTEEMENRGSVERRLEHRIIVSPWPHQRQRWSDVQPCDLLYLTSEMIISSESRRVTRIGNRRGRGIMKSSRSVSEITGLSRFPSSSSKSNNNINNNNNNNNNGTGAGRGEQGDLLLSLSSSYQSHDQQPPAVR